VNRTQPTASSEIGRRLNRNSRQLIATADAAIPEAELAPRQAPSGLAAVHRELIITLAARYRLPAVYSYRYFVTDGGLTSYGPDPIDHYRRAAGYVDRILKGEKPGDEDVPLSQA
jgi:putative tryptophan/tyrosine transport system substrate-binding protein